MDNDPCLILFIDGLPYDRLDECDYLCSLDGGSVTPGFGYSVNQQALLFSGLTPDDLGIFGEWNYVPADDRDHTTISNLGRLLSPFDRLRRYFPLFDRGVHYLLDRKFGRECANIPFRALQYFDRTGAYPLTDAYDRPTIMSRGEFQMIVHDFAPVSYDRKDERAVADAKTALSDNEDRLFVSLPTIDGLAHQVGTDSAAYSRGLAELDERCRDLVAAFRERHPEGRVVVCSDHGIATAHDVVDLELPSRIGFPSEALVYFYDSVYFRAWINDQSSGDRLRRILENTDVGKILSAPEREEHGLERWIHGDIIFVLNEGYSFAPNYFGYRPLAAYHGYHPSTQSQQAVFLTSGFEECDYPESLGEAYEFMAREVLDSEASNGK